LHLLHTPDVCCWIGDFTPRLDLGAAEPVPNPFFDAARCTNPRSRSTFTKRHHHPPARGKIE
jgi:hypothetical protein